MMIGDDRGQVSLEYMLIAAVALVLLIAFTIPLTGFVVENTLDVSDTLDVKSDLSKIANGIMQVYGEGQGSKQTINVESASSIEVNIANSHISSSLKLRDGSSKVVKVNCRSTLAKSDIYLSKGKNTIIVEWPAESKNMKIYTKLF
jgi:uncharacterized protein (UPF0333 family)